MGRDLEIAGSLSHGSYYGSSIALIIHSVDRSLFSHLIAIRSFEGSLSRSLSTRLILQKTQFLTVRSINFLPDKKANQAESVIIF